MRIRVRPWSPLTSQRAPGMCGTRAMGFVVRLLAAHGRLLATIRPVERVIRSQGRRVAYTYVNALAQVNLALVTRPPLALQRHTLATTLIAWMPVASQPLTDRPALMSRSSSMVLARLFSREQRIERHAIHETRIVRPAETGEAPHPVAAARPSRRLELVMRRTMVVEPSVAAQSAAAQAATAAARAERPDRSSSWPASAAPHAIPLSPHELGRLTDEVVRTLDRRLVSYRERMGAI